MKGTRQLAKLMKHPEHGAILNFKKRSDSALFHTLRLAEKLHSSVKKKKPKPVPGAAETRHPTKRKSRKRGAKTLNFVSSGIGTAENERTGEAAGE